MPWDRQSNSVRSRDRHGMSWAGIQDIMMLTGALSASCQNLPGRDVILVSAFSVIIVTVLLQGSTLAASRWTVEDC